MRTHALLRNLVAGTGILVILACGGGGDIAGNSFPLKASVTVICVNNDNQPVHILIGGEAFNQAANQVPANNSRTRTSPISYTWNDANSTVKLDIFAGRNGVVLGNKFVNMTGDERMSGMKLRAVWNANQTLTLTKE